MIELIFATNNQHKVDEISSMVSSHYKIITLKEAGIEIEIPEPHDNLMENALEKSRTIHEITGKNCFSEDTGLFVKSLDGKPGVKSARYAGERKTSEDNIDKLFNNLKNINDREAYFQTVISLIFKTKKYFFEGTCMGIITSEVLGKNGFGYDSIFIPDDAKKTFAEMSMKEKNLYSHRKKATQKLITFLSQNGNL